MFVSCSGHSAAGGSKYFPGLPIPIAWTDSFSCRQFIRPRLENGESRNRASMDKLSGPLAAFARSTALARRGHWQQHHGCEHRRQRGWRRISVYSGRAAEWRRRGSIKRCSQRVQ